jgi:hypothetical protein
MDANGKARLNVIPGADDAALNSKIAVSADTCHSLPERGSNLQ